MTAGLSRRAGTVVGALVLSFVAVSGCGGSKTSSAPPNGTGATTVARGTNPTSTVAVSDGSGTDASACHLLGEGDVTTAMKRPMKVVGGAGAAICTWSATDDPSVTLAVQTFATQKDAALYTQVESSADHVDGLGDDAFWSSTLDLVYVRKGDRSFVVTSPSLANLVGDPQASKSAVVNLATIVLGKF